MSIFSITRILSVLTAAAMIIPSAAGAKSYYVTQNGYTLQTTGVDIFGDLNGPTQLLVPAGKWLITAKTAIFPQYPGNAEATAYCTIFVNGSAIDGSFNSAKSTVYIPAITQYIPIANYAAATADSFAPVTLTQSSNLIQYICYGSNQLGATESGMSVVPWH